MKQFPSSTFNKLANITETENYTNYIKRECEKYGIPVGVFSSDKEIYTDYEREALTIIEMGKQLSPELKQKLLSTIELRKVDRERKYTDAEITDELAESILGFKI